MSGMNRLRPRDYRSVYLGTNHEFLVQSQTLNGLEGLWYNEFGQGGFSASVPYLALNSFEVSITDYFGELEFRYQSPIRFLAGKYLLLDWIALFRERFARLFYNKKKLFRADRLEVLRLIAAKSIDNAGFSTSPSGLMTLLYGPRWAGHPKADSLLRYYRLIVESLVSSGDLRQQSGSSEFLIQGQGLSTLSDNEDSDRKHRDAIRMQLILAALTFLLFLVSALQLYSSWPTRPSGP